MRPSTVRRASFALSLTLTLALNVAPARATDAHGLPSSRPAAAAAAYALGGGLSSDDVRRLAAPATQPVIVLLRDGGRALPDRGPTRAARVAAVAADQQPVLDELRQLHAPRVRAFHLIDAVAATVSPAEEARLRADPAVQEVIADRTVRLPRLALPAAAHMGGAPARLASPPFIPACENTISLEPQALQLTNTAFPDATAPQAQGIVTGTGVTVAFLADGLDVTNPDFIRRDGSRVITDYQDFSGEGTAAPTNGQEAFGAASSIAAQGRTIYNVNDVVNAAHKRTGADCPKIRILGMAPGASLMALKITNSADSFTTSAAVQAVEYAVDHGADVINESIYNYAFLNTDADALSLVNDAAVAAGVTVVAASGDAGPGHTIGEPPSDPNVIAVGATTELRLWQQATLNGFQLGNGDYEGSACNRASTTCRRGDNMSADSSAGPSQTGRHFVDVVAPADDGWIVCSPTTDGQGQQLYGSCVDFNGNPSPIDYFGGTSEAAPFTAGEVALVIQAYRQTHGGATPAPALVKNIIMSTATDLNIPANEQGAGLINSLKAVRVARSYGGAAPPEGNALLVSPGMAVAEAAPGMPRRITLHVTNSGARARVVAPRVRTLGAPAYQASFAVPLHPTAAGTSTFIDQFGTTRAYTEQTFAVPARADRLDAAIAFDAVAYPYTNVRLALLDPQGRYTAYSQPIGVGSGYGHVSVRNPQAGTWTAIIITRASASGYDGLVQLDVATSDFTTLGAVAPTGRLLAPGESSTFVVTVPGPAQPGQEDAEVAIDGAGAVPLLLRAPVPLPRAPAPATTTFTGTLAGGNGEPGVPGYVSAYDLNVPAGLHDLDLGVTVADANNNLEGLLVDPHGLPVDVQSTVTATDPSSGQPTAYTNTLQFFRRDPQAGRWRFILTVNHNVSGQATTLPFTATVAYDGARVAAPGVPSDPGVTLPQGSVTSIPVTITNTGNTTKSFVVDARLAQHTVLSVGAFTRTVFLPGAQAPTVSFLVPPESTTFSVAARATTPGPRIAFDLYNWNGAPSDGNTNAPDIESDSFLDPATGTYAAAATSKAAPGGEVVPGLWEATLSQVGPYPAAGPAPVTATIGGVVDTAQFDPAIVASSGDPYADQVAAEGGQTGVSTGGGSPLTLAPGQTGVITLTVTPAAAPGTVARGSLYVDTVNSITNSGDELRAIPYAYTVGAPVSGTDTPPAATETGVASATGTAVPATPTGGTATGSPVAATTTVATAAASGTPTATGTVSATATTTDPTATPSAESPTGTATSHTASPTETSTAVATTAAPTATATGTASPMATDDETTTPTGAATGTASPTATGAVASTATGTVAPTATATVAATPAGTSTPPTPPCHLFVVPGFNTVPRGGGQVLLLDAVPETPITLTVGARYPATAILFDGGSAGSPDGGGTSLVGTRVRGGYRYTIRVGVSGLALLAFTIPRDARQGTVATLVTAQEPCGLFKTVVTFEAHGKARGSAPAHGDGRAATLTIALPRGDGLPAGIGRLVRQGKARVLIHGHGRKTQRVLVLTYYPRVRTRA